MDKGLLRAQDRKSAELLAGLSTDGSPQLAFLRRAPAGISGGPGSLLCLSASFNPLTVAHLQLVREASRIVPPDEILLLLARANVDKAVEGFPLEYRLELLARFIETRAAYSIAVCSHGRFVDKAEAIRPHYPSGTRLVFLVGFDTLIRLFDAKYYPDPSNALSRLFSGSEFIVANRHPTRPTRLKPSWFARTLRHTPTGFWWSSFRLRSPPCLPLRFEPASPAANRWTTWFLRKSSRYWIHMLRGRTRRATDFASASPEDGRLQPPHAASFA